MNTVLTDEEIGSIAQKTHDGISPHNDTIAFARAIEAAVLEKFGEPVAWIHKQRDDVVYSLSDMDVYPPQEKKLFYPLYAIKKEGA